MLRKLSILGVLVLGGLCVVAIVSAQDSPDASEPHRSLLGPLDKLRESFLGSNNAGRNKKSPAASQRGGKPLNGFGRGTRFLNKPTKNPYSIHPNSPPVSRPTIVRGQPNRPSYGRPTPVTAPAERQRPSGAVGRSVLTKSSPRTPTSAASKKPLSQATSGSFSAGSSLSDRLRAVRSGAATHRRPATTVSPSRSTAGSLGRSTTGSLGRSTTGSLGRSTTIAPPRRTAVPRGRSNTTVEKITPALSPRRVIGQSSTDGPAARVARAAKSTVPSTTKPASRTAATAGATLFSTQSPVIQVATSGPRKIVIGKQATYRVTVVNGGNQAADDVVVSMKLPSWAEVVSAKPSTGSTHIPRGDERSEAFAWRIPRLEARAKQRLLLHLIPRKSRAFPLSVQWTFTPKASQAIVEVLEPKLQMAIAGPDEVRYGSTEQYRLTVSNPGTGDAENVVIRMSTSGSGNAGVARHVIGTIGAGASKVLKLKLTATQAGTLLVKAQAAGDGGLSDEVTEKVLVRRAGLQIQASGPAVRYAGTPVLFQVKVTNPGNDVAENVKVEAMLPPGAKFISSAGGLLSAAGNKVNWSIANLQPGMERAFDVKCTLNTAGKNRLQVTASASRDLADSNTVAIQVEALADLKLEVADPQGPVPVGEEIEYEIRLRNRGTKRAEQIRMVVFFSAGVEAVKVTGGRHKIDVGQVTFDQISAVEANSELIFKITARASRPGNHGFRVEVEADDPETRLVAEETTRFYGQIWASPSQGIAGNPNHGNGANGGSANRTAPPTRVETADKRALPAGPTKNDEARYE